MRLRIIKLVISAIVAAIDSTVLIANKRFSRRVVLYYHSVAQEQRSRFANQMDILLGFSEALPLDSIARPIKKMFGTAVTFDDGYRTVLDNAVPELVKRGIPYTIFIPSGDIGTHPKWLNEKELSVCGRIMNENELKLLGKNDLVTFGSHCVSHPNLRRLDDTSVNIEFTESKKDLERVFGRIIDILSFPYGAFEMKHIEMAKKAGYVHVVTTMPAIISPGTENYAIGRVWTDPDDWNLEFRLKLAGAYRWLPCAFAFKKKVANFFTHFKD